MNKLKSRQSKILNSLNIFLLVALVFSGSYCIKSIDDIVNKNFELQELQEKLTDLESENSQLELTKSELQSHSVVMSRIEDMSMVKVDNIESVSLPDDSLARR